VGVHLVLLGLASWYVHSSCKVFGKKFLKVRFLALGFLGLLQAGLEGSLSPAMLAGRLGPTKQGVEVPHVEGAGEVAWCQVVKAS
jgi:hypothetical protein